MVTFAVFIDNGHGGIVNGQYVTAGKRSPKFEDGTQLFEGVYNRKISRLLMEKLINSHTEGMYIENVAPSEMDTPLSNRVKEANGTWLALNKPESIYISIHGDANGDGIQWDQASGISVYTSKGQTKSDIFASILLDKLDNIVTGVKWRTDALDGDVDKEENFYVLKETMMPAALSENGFMSNKEEAKRMLTKEWQENIAEAHYQAIMDFRKLRLKL